jgi:hypothetical protein
LIELLQRAEVYVETTSMVVRRNCKTMKEFEEKRLQ